MDEHIDLSSFDDDFDKAPNEEQQIPDGDYVVKVDKALLAKARSSGAPMLRWSLKILEGPFAGRMLFRNNVMLTTENIQWLKRDLHHAGINLPKLSHLEHHLGQFLDVKLEVTKKSRGDNYNVYINKRLGMATDDAPRSTSGDGLPF
jgi:hypothetical protein